MTIFECYTTLHGSYKEAQSRLMTDKIIEKFLLKFTADPSMSQLLDAANTNDRKQAFMAAHTLKGVSGNLGFTELQQCASDLTEHLRSGENDIDLVMLEKIKTAYRLVIDTIHTYSESNQ